MRLPDIEGEFVSTVWVFVEVLNRDLHAYFLFFAYTGININDGTYVIRNFVSDGGFSSIVENEKKSDCANR